MSTDAHATVPKISAMRVIEAIVIAVVTSVISTALSLYVTVNVLKTDLSNIKESVKGLENDQKFLQEQILEWYRTGGRR